MLIFYQRQLATQDKGADYSDDLEYARGYFYKQLLDIYGDEVHRVFFGTSNNAMVKQQILDEFTSEVILNLFPPSEEELAELSNVEQTEE